jgi:hypothetical protein
MGLNHVAPIIENDRRIAAISQTWGHLSPQKNHSYPGKIKFCLTDHSQYGRQPIIITYDFGDLYGPYIHDFLFDKICDYNTDDLIVGCIYEQKLTFRNYRFYYGKIIKIL